MLHVRSRSPSCRLIDVSETAVIAPPNLTGSVSFEGVAGGASPRWRMRNSTNRLPWRSRQTIFTRSPAVKPVSEGETWVIAHVVTIELALLTETASPDIAVITPFTLRPLPAEAGSAKQRTTANAAQGRISRFMRSSLLPEMAMALPRRRGFLENPSIGRDLEWRRGTRAEP